MNDIVVYTIPEGDWEALYVNGEKKAEGHHILIGHLKQHTPIQSIKEIHIENFDSDRDNFPETIFDFPKKWKEKVI